MVLKLTSGVPPGLWRTSMEAKHAIRGGLGEDGVALDPVCEQLGLSMREAVANLASDRVSELPANS